MQDHELRISDILSYAARHHGDLNVSSVDEDGQFRVQSYHQTKERADQLTSRLLDEGLKPQSCIASLALNTRRHLELYYGVTGAGHILHTINPRFDPHQIQFTVDQAKDAIVFFDPAFTAQAVEIAAKSPFVQSFVCLCEKADLPDASLPGLTDYESYISNAPKNRLLPERSERDGAFLCYTSGTTGDPKGVLYAHRSCMIHALAAGGPGNFNIAPQDVVLPCASMYHATAWALPLITPMNGARLVLPGARLDGASLLDLCIQEGVTLAWGVPTIWKTVLDEARKQNRKLPALKRIYIGGSAVPPELKRSFRDELDVEIVQVWGMTETSPLGVIATPSAKVSAMQPEDRNELLTAKQGRIPFGVELTVRDEAENDLPHDGKTSGNLMIRGPWIVNQYFGHNTPATDEHGWFDTGDVATIDADGFMQITDRTKDIIKSGGEWISSIVLENTAVEHPAIANAAAIGLAHPKWDERPLLVFTPIGDAKVTAEDIIQFMSSRLPKWWVPEAAVERSDLPLTATGKIDKKVLRRDYENFYK